MKRVLLALGLFASLIVPASAHGFKIGELAIVHPFLRATPPTATTTAGYMVIRNQGSASDRLLRIETTAAEKVTFHRTVIDRDIAKMVPIEEGFEIPAGGEFRLGADGTHAMLVGLTGPIDLGFLIEATLVFERAGALPMTFEVEPAGTQLEDTEAHHEQ